MSKAKNAVELQLQHGSLLLYSFIQQLGSLLHVWALSSIFLLADNFFSSFLLTKCNTKCSANVSVFISRRKLFELEDESRKKYCINRELQISLKLLNVSNAVLAEHEPCEATMLVLLEYDVDMLGAILSRYKFCDSKYILEIGE